MSWRRFVTEIARYCGGSPYARAVCRQIVHRVERCLLDEGVADPSCARLSPAAIYLARKAIEVASRRGPEEAGKWLGKAIDRLSRWASKVVERVLPLTIIVPNGRGHSARVSAWVEYGGRDDSGGERLLVALFFEFPTDPPRMLSEVEPVVVEVVGGEPVALWTRVHYEWVRWGPGKTIAFAPLGHTPIPLDALPESFTDPARGLWLGVGWLWGRLAHERSYRIERATLSTRPAPAWSGAVSVSPVLPVTGVNPFESPIVPREWGPKPITVREVVSAARSYERRKKALERDVA